MICLRNGILAAIVGALFLLHYSSVFAHGGGTPRLTNEPIGPYRLFAWSSPEPLRAGEVHMTFALVIPPDSDKPIDEGTLFNDLDQVVSGAEINVTYISVAPTGTELKSKAASSSINPLYYETDVELPHAGTWQIEVDVTGEVGRGRVIFSTTVEEAQLIDWQIVGAVIVTFSFLIFASRVRSTGARRRAARKP